MTKKSLKSNGHTRLPLVRLFSGALASVLLLFTLVTSLTFYRLLDFRDILLDVTQHSVPTMALSSQISNQVSALTHLTEGMTNTTSDVARRSQQHRINVQLDNLRELAELENVDPYLRVQLDALSLELNDLNLLVQQRLVREKLLEEKKAAIYQLYEHSRLRMDASASNQIIATQHHWSQNFSDIVAQAGRLAGLNRLHQIRKLDEEIRRRLATLKTQASLVPPNIRQQAISYSQQLDDLMNGEQGLIEQQVDLLRIRGRTTGRGNYVRNLILDYAGMAEYQSATQNEEIILEAVDIAEQVNQQIRILGVSSALALIFLILVTYFLHKRVVSRLNKLNSLVKQRLAGHSMDIQVEGNDEISDLSRSFEAFAQTVEKQNQILHDLSLSDGLTGISNRRALDERLEHELRIARRHNWSVSVLLLDVDYFKTFNDKYGHAKGDECLIEVAQLLDKQMKRTDDFVARYGGEEFACILPDTDETGAERVARSIQDAIAAMQYPHEYSPVADYLTVSIGITTINTQLAEEAGYSTVGSVHANELLKQADKALYKAKESGRNRYFRYQQLLQSQAG